ncbi:hypothetical protein D3C84_1062370 [compost metagenome]
MNSAGDWAKVLLANRPSNVAKLALHNRVAIRFMVAPSLKSSNGSFRPRLSIKTTCIL